MGIPYTLFKKVAFQFDPENVHELAISFMKYGKLFSPLFRNKSFNPKGDRYRLKFKKSKMSWPYPVGFAAGFDKNGEVVNFLSRLNLGAVEVGTVTPLAQPGNNKPRLFRYPEERSLRNCMGFNNEGADYLLYNIEKSSTFGRSLGINLGKNKTTPAADAWKDYKILYQKFAPISDYLVINVSSPNTPGLRDLQARSELMNILDKLAEDRRSQPVPLFIKISPDLSDDDILGVISLARDYELDGIIATNTTIMPEKGEGGVSGELLLEKSRRVREFILSEMRDDDKFDLIGVGGFSSFDDIWKFWQQGGRFVQVYTSFIFQGPQLLNDIRNEIDRVLEKNNMSSLEVMLENIKQVKR